MFDFVHSQPRKRAVPARLLGIEFVASSGARLILVASRIGGEEGAALACTCRDMILDRDTDPLHWPIDELTDLLRSPTQKRDGQVEQLIRRLDHLQHEIDRAGEDATADGLPRPVDDPAAHPWDAEPSGAATAVPEPGDRCSLPHRSAIAAVIPAKARPRFRRRSSPGPLMVHRASRSSTVVGRG